MRFLLPVLLIALLAGCGRPADLRQVRGEYDRSEVRHLAYSVAFEWGLLVRAVADTGSNGDIMGGRTFVLLTDSFDTIERGKLVVYRFGGKEIFHQVVGGGPGAWQVQGMANPSPDPVPVTRDNYVGTYVGRFDSN